MSTRPGRITEEIKVPFSRPRDAGITVSHEFGDLKRRCLELLHSRQQTFPLHRLEPLGIDLGGVG
jgi:NitT/TauT family transport system ATP-binding protein